MGSPTPLLTVISNVYNDAERLPRAVRSALAGWERPDQSGAGSPAENGDIEVLVVDDGSTDDTGRVADELAAADDRVRVLHRGHNDGAPGAPRNLGLDGARGAWVAFVDSDDEYLPGSLRRLVDAAVAADADVAVGAVARHNERTGLITPLHATDYVSGSVGPLGPGSPLWHDTIAVAKVMRRSMLDDHGIRFPERILYEDQPFTVALWMNARRIATVDQVVYHWYVYNLAGQESITARRHEIGNFHDRIAANRAIDEQLAGRPDLTRAKLDKFVRHDLALYGKDLDGRDDDYLVPFLAAARDYLATQPEPLRRALPQPYRLAVRELVDGSRDSAVSAASFAYRRNHLDRPLSRRGRGWWWPYRPAEESTGDHDLTRLVRREHAKGRRLRTVLCTDLRTDDGGLVMSGSVVDGDDSLGSAARMTLVLRDRPSRAELATATTRLGEDGTFAVRLDLSRMPPGARPTTAWDLKVSFAGPLRRVLPARLRWLPAVELSPDVELPSLNGGLEAYRTLNGFLSLRALAEVR